MKRLLKIHWITLFVLVFVLHSAHAQILSLAGNDETFDVHITPPNKTAFKWTYAIHNIDAVNAVSETDAILEVSYNDLEFEFDPNEISGYPFGWSCSDDQNANKVTCTNNSNCTSGCPSIQPNSALNIDVGFKALGTAIAGSAATHDFFSQVRYQSALQNDSAIKKVNIIIDAALDLEVKKYVKDGVLGNIIANSTIPFGSTFYYSIQVNNVSATNATSVTVKDVLPLGVRFQQFFDPNGGGWSCSAGAFSVSTAQVVTCTTNTTIPANTPNSNKYAYLEVKGETSGLKTNVVSLMTSTPQDTTPTNNTNTNTNQIQSLITIGAEPQVQVSLNKSITAGVSNGYAQNGATVTYKVLFDNTTSGTNAKNVIITDTLPNAVTFQSVTALGNFMSSSGGNGCQYDTSSKKITCTTPNEIPQTTAEDGFTVNVMVNGNNGDTVTNTAEVTLNNGPTTQSNAVFNIGTNPTTVDLTLNKTLLGSATTPAQFNVNEAFEYELILHNNGADDALAGYVEVVDLLPENISFQQSDLPLLNWNCTVTPTGTPARDQLKCTNTAVITGNGGVLKLNFHASSAVVGSYINQADVSITSLASSNNVTESNTQNNDDTVQVIIAAASLNFNVDAIVAGNAGDEFDIKVAIQNTGATPLIGVVFENTLPAGFSYVAQGTDAICTANNLLMSCVLASDVAMNETRITTIRAKSDAAIDTNVSYSNLTKITSADNFDPNNVPQVNRTIQFAPPTNAAFAVHLNDSTDPVDVGTAYDYIVSFDNTGNTTMNSLEFEVLLPVELTQNSMTMVNNLSCSNTSAQTVHCVSTTGFSLNPNNSVNAVTLNVQSTNFVGTLTASVNALNGATIVQTDTEQTTITSTQAVVHDVSLTKTANVSEITVNGEFEYEIEVSNLDTQDLATGINVTDDLSQVGVTLVSIDADAVFTCSGTTVITCIATQLPASTSAIIHLRVKAPAQIGAIVNTATVVTDSVDTNSNNNSSNVSVEVVNTPVVLADLLVTKTAPAAVSSGDELMWNIKLHNNGPDTATTIHLQDVLPAGFDFISVNDSACSQANGTLDCSIASLANGADREIEIKGQVTMPQGQLSNTAKIISADTTDSDSNNNTSTAQVVVNPVQQNTADLAINIESLNNGSYNQGDSMDFIMHVRNEGPDSAHKPTVNATITGLIRSVSIEENSDWACQINGFNIACEFNADTMPNGYHMPLGFSVITDRVVQTSEDLNIIAVIASTTADNDLSNNTSQFNVQINPSPSEEDILSAMQTALTGLASQQTSRAIKNVASYCARRYFWALEGMCDDLYQAALAGEGETVNNVMQEITPNEVIGQSTSVAEIANAQFRNVGARLAEIRGGGGSGFSASGLTASMGNGGIPLNMLAYLNKADQKTDGISKVQDDFISPWGFFINGTISMGKRDATGRELGFDFNSYGLTAGFDYRISSKNVVGVALGYANFDSQIDKDSASLKSTGMTLTAYGAFNISDNFYMDARISYGKPDFKQSRNINFTLGNRTIDRTAVGKTTANQYSVALSAGYTFNKNAWSITPNGSVRYAKTRIGGFTETGAGDFNFEFSNQTLDSLLWSAGLRVSKAISLKSGVITPQFDIDYNYESLNDGTNIEARFIKAPDGEVFIIETDSPDRTYGSAGLGIVYITANGKQAYINYRSTIGLQGFSRGTFNLGARFEF